jgi:hypothetical protein
LFDRVRERVGSHRMDAMEAFVVGALAQSSLLVSGVAVYFFTLPDRVVAPSQPNQRLCQGRTGFPAD